jgi:hypothetical protein
MGLVENDDFCGRDGDFTKFTGSKPSVLTSEATDMWISCQLPQYLLLIRKLMFSWNCLDLMSRGSVKELSIAPLKICCCQSMVGECSFKISQKK